MPLYEYKCPECDTYFTSVKNVSDYNSHCYCPECTTLAVKIFRTPRLNIMQQETRKAHETNERSAHNPKVKHHHTCDSSCNHHQSATPTYKQQANRRPWVLGH